MTNGLKNVVFFTALFFSCLLFAGAFASALNLTTVCGTLPTAGEYYQLQNNVSASGTCFNVTAANVTIDCSGFTINYSSTGAGNGVYSNSTNTTVKNCIVKQMNISNTNSHAIYYVGVSSGSGTIFNNTLTILNPDCFGILLSSSSNNNITNNSVTARTGIYLNLVSNNSLSSNIIIVSGASYGGIQINAGSDNNVMNNTISGIPAWGIHVFTSSNNNTFTSNNITVTGTGYGFSSESSTNSTLTGNRFNTTSAVGVYVTGTTSSHYNQSIDTSNLAEGLPIWYNYSASNSVILQNTDVSGTIGQLVCAWCSNVTYDNVTMGNDGFSFYNTSTSIINNSKVTTSKGYGVFAYGSNSAFLQNNLFNLLNITTTTNSNLYGIYLLTASGNNVTNSNVNTNGTNGYGFYLKTSSTGNSIKDSLINASNSGIADIKADSGINNFTNCTFNKSDTSITSTGSIDVFWYADAFVNDTTGNAVNGANVSISDNAGSLLNWSLTNSSGYASRITIQEYMQNTTAVYNMTPHNYTAAAMGHNTTSANFSIVQSYIAGVNPIVLTLGIADTPPTSVLNSPVNNYGSNLSNITFNCTATDDVNLTDVTLYGDWTGSWTANETNSTPINNYPTTFTKTISGGTYLWNCLACDNASQCSFATSNNTFTIDGTPPVASQGTNPVDNYNSTSSSITFDMKCSDNAAVGTIQLWGNWTGIWQVNYTNSSYANNTWLNITVAGISNGNYKWAVWCNDTAENTNITINRTLNVIAPSTCGTLSASNSVYNLINSVSSTGTCFNVTASNVTIDCNGYGINYSSATTGYGVYSNQLNTTVENCGFINQTNSSLSTTSIYFSGNDGTIYNNTIGSLTYPSMSIQGIYISNANYTTIDGNTIIMNDTIANKVGIYVFGETPYLSIIRNTIGSNYSNSTRFGLGNGTASGYAIRVASGDNINLSNNTLWLSNVSIGMRSDAGNILDPMYNLTISNNYLNIDNNYISYMILVGAERGGIPGATIGAQILNNALYAPTDNVSINHALFVGYSINPTVANNYVSGGFYSIAMKGNQNGTVTNNTGTWSGGGYADSSSQNIIYRNNTIVGDDHTIRLLYLKNSDAIHNRTANGSIWYDTQFTYTLGHTLFSNSLSLPMSLTMINTIVNGVPRSPIPSTLIDENTTLYTGWYYRAYVYDVNTGLPVANANILVQNSSNETVWNLTTGADGFTDTEYLIEHVTNNDIPVDVGLYNTTLTLNGAQLVRRNYNATTNNLSDTFGVASPSPTPVYVGSGGSTPTPTPTVTVTPAPTVSSSSSSPAPSVASTTTPSPSPSASPSVQPSVSGLNAAKEKDVRAGISVVQELIRVAKSQNKDVQEAERLLGLAQQAFERGDYAAASAYLQQSDAALKKAGVATKGVSSAGFDWTLAGWVAAIVLVAGGAYWFYSRRWKGK